MAQKELKMPFKDRFHSSVKLDIPSPQIYDPLKAGDILNIMHQTADWQLANPWRKSSRLDWHWGAFYTGLRALYEVTGEDRYKNEMINIGQSNNWKPMDDIFHADSPEKRCWNAQPLCSSAARVWNPFAASISRRSIISASDMAAISAPL